MSRYSFPNIPQTSSVARPLRFGPHRPCDAGSGFRVLNFLWQVTAVFQVPTCPSAVVRIRHLRKLLFSGCLLGELSRSMPSPRHRTPPILHFVPNNPTARLGCYPSVIPHKPTLEQIPVPELHCCRVRSTPASVP